MGDKAITLGKLITKASPKSFLATRKTSPNILQDLSMKVLRSIQPNERRLWCEKAVLLRKPSEKERQRLSKNSGNKLPKPSKMTRICLSETIWLQMKKQFQEERLPSDAAKRTSSKFCSLVINLCKSLMMPRKCKCFIKLFFVKLDLFTNLLLSLARRKLNKGERLQKMSI